MKLSARRVAEIKAYSHQGLPLSYELTTDTGLPSREFAIHPTTGVVDLLRPLDYESDPHQYHLKVKVKGRGQRSRSFGERQGQSFLKVKVKGEVQRSRVMVIVSR